MKFLNSQLIVIESILTTQIWLSANRNNYQFSAKLQRPILITINFIIFKLFYI